MKEKLVDNLLWAASIFVVLVGVMLMSNGVYGFCLVLSGLSLNPKVRGALSLKVPHSLIVAAAFFALAVYLTPSSRDGAQDDGATETQTEVQTEIAEEEDPVESGEEKSKVPEPEPEPETEPEKKKYSEDEVSDAFYSLDGCAVDAAIEAAEKYGIAVTYECAGRDVTEYVDEYRDGFVVECVYLDYRDREAKFGLLTEEAYELKVQRKALEEKLPPLLAWDFVSEYGQSAYPYGFKLHYFTGKISEDMKDPDTWILKAKCDVTNAFGATGHFTCTAEVTGDMSEMKIIAFSVD